MSAPDRELRRDLRSIVAAIAPLDARERADQRATLEWIDSGASLWRTEPPATPPEHLVVYCALVDPDARAMLLIDHRNALLWLPNGGHVDPHEPPADAAARELEEELGIIVDPLVDGPTFLTWTTTVGLDGGHVDVSLWYAFRGTLGMGLTPDPGEFVDHRWWPFADIAPAGRFDPELPRFITKLAANL